MLKLRLTRVSLSHAGAQKDFTSTLLTTEETDSGECDDGANSSQGSSSVSPSMSVLSPACSWAMATPDHSPRYQQALDPSRRASEPALPKTSRLICDDLSKPRRCSAPEVLSGGASSSTHFRHASVPESPEGSPAGNPMIDRSGVPCSQALTVSPEHVAAICSQLFESSSVHSIGSAKTTNCCSNFAGEALLSQIDVVAICAPYFEQMVTAVNLALEKRVNAGPRGSSPSTPEVAQQFSSAISLPALGGANEVCRSMTQVTSKVCCHWRRKGWCRYEDSCKFSHVADARGIGRLKSSSKASVGSPNGMTPKFMSARRWHRP